MPPAAASTESSIGRRSSLPASDPRRREQHRHPDHDRKRVEANRLQEPEAESRDECRSAPTHDRLVAEKPQGSEEENLHRNLGVRVRGRSTPGASRTRGKRSHRARRPGCAGQRRCHHEEGEQGDRAEDRRQHEHETVATEAPRLGEQARQQVRELERQLRLTLLGRQARRRDVERWDHERTEARRELEISVAAAIHRAALL